MKICAIICEYNPFHNGHLYQLRQARERSGADAVLCIMSGNFLQRGESSILEKHVRAKHALQAGADVVLELPAVFATSNAELFAKGAIRILSSIPAVNTLCFGAENADKTAFKLAARYLNNEPKEVSEIIKQEIEKGASYAKARALGFAGFIPLDMLSSPNNILGLEYTRAIQDFNADMEILPITRKGAHYADEELQENYSSASAIRSALQNGTPIDGNVPNYVLNDLKNPPLENHLETLEKYALIARSTEEIKRVCDCSEGLENALKRTAESNLPLIQTLTSARYTSSRIRRIALQNLLKIEKRLIEKALLSPLYLRVLGAKKEKTDVLSALGESDLPLIIRAHDEDVLQGTAKEVFEKDVFAEKIYALLNSQATEKRTLFI